MKGLDETTRELIGLFERLSAPYAVMGGLAVRIHALPRPTYDVDFTVAIPREQLSELYAAAQHLGFAVPSPQLAGWVDTVRELPVIKLQWYVGERAIDADLFLAETPFQHEVLRRRQRHGAEGWEGWFVSAEDLILLKLIANRIKDQADIADILFIQGQLDEQYMRKWAGELGVTDALVRALQ